MTMSCHLRWVG